MLACVEGGKVAPAPHAAPAGSSEDGNGGAGRWPIMTGAPAGAIGVATVGASGIRLQARAHEAAPKPTKAGGPVLVAALLAALLVLAIELADDHGPDRVPGGTVEAVTIVDHRTSGIPGGKHGPAVVASTRRIDG